MSRKLLKNTAIVSGMTLVSRVLGLVRDIVLARFGATAGMDAFFVAFKIPNFLRRLFAEGAFAQAFVPVLAEYREQRSPEAVQELISRVAGTLLGILSLVAVVGVLASPVLITVFAPGFLYRDVAQFDLAAGMLRLTFPYILFVSLVAFAAGVLNTFGRFAAASFTPVWLNIVLISAALLVAPRLEQAEMALAGGVLVAGIVQLLFLLPSLRRIRSLPRPRWGIRDSGVRRIMKLMVPGIIGSSAAQINLLVDTMLASFLVTGSVTWLFYSDRLMEFPLGVFAIALSTVILPSLSRSHANNAHDEFSATLDWGLRGVMLVGIPSVAGLVLLARPILATLFQHGDFTAADVDMAGLSLTAYAIGLPGFMLIKVLAPAFFSRKDPRTPVRIAIIALVITLVLNLTFVLGMLKLGIPGAHAGLALATSLGAWVNAGLLYRNLYRNRIYRPLPGWGRYAMQVLIAVVVLSALLYAGVPDIDAWLAREAMGRALWLLLWVAAGIFTYFLVLRLAGVRFSTVWRKRPEGSGGA